VPSPTGIPVASPTSSSTNGAQMHTPFWYRYRPSRHPQTPPATSTHWAQRAHPLHSTQLSWSTNERNHHLRLASTTSTTATATTVQHNLKSNNHSCIDCYTGREHWRWRRRVPLLETLSWLSLARLLGPLPLKWPAPMSTCQCLHIAPNCFLSSPHSAVYFKCKWHNEEHLL